MDAAADGEEGLWYATSGNYDAMVLDLMLPKLDGLTLLKRFRNGGHKTPVLILTARDTVPDRVKGLDSGADDYLVKPFAFEEFLARIRVLVRRKHQVASPVIKAGDLSIDTSAKRVFLEGQEVILSAQPYALLELLAMRAGQIVSRTQIWDHLYAFDSDPSSNVIEVCMVLLRKKLHRPGKDDLIQTRRGLGYILEANATDEP